jgi:tetratricopeptide (TPR) repeat protein
MKHDLTANIEQIIHLQAKQCYQEAETLCCSLLMQLPINSNNLSIRVSLQNRLIAILEAQSRYEEALTYTQIALTELETFKSEIASNLKTTLESITLSKIGNLERILGHYSNAEQAYLKTLSLSESEKSNNQECWLKLSNDLAIVYKYWGKFDKAEKIYQQILSVLLQQCGENNINVATVYHNLAGLNHSRHRYIEAEILARKSYQLHLQLLGEDHPQTYAKKPNRIFEKTGVKKNPRYLQIPKIAEHWFWQVESY